MRISSTTSKKKLLAFALAAFLTPVALGACGTDPATVASRSGSNGDTAQAAEGKFPVEVTTAGGKVTIDARPERIVSLSPTATEMLFAIDAGDQVVAVDELSNYPADAPVTDLSGFTPNVEAIVGYQPDLVVVANDIDGLAERLDDLDTPLLMLPPADELDGMYDEIEQLGQATGHTTEATKLADSVASDIDDLVAQLPKSDKPLTYYHELDTTYYTVTSKTFLGAVYSLAGLKNIADAADDGTGYPQLSPEQIITADPDFIFLANTKCCQQSAATVAARPGWSGLKAVTDSHVVNLDDDIASRWGPRVVDLLETVVDAVKDTHDHAAAGPGATTTTTTG